MAIRKEGIGQGIAEAVNLKSLLSAGLITNDEYSQHIDDIRTGHLGLVSRMKVATPAPDPVVIPEADPVVEPAPVVADPTPVLNAEQQADLDALQADLDAQNALDS